MLPLSVRCRKIAARPRLLRRSNRLECRDFFYGYRAHHKDNTAWLPFLDTYRTMCLAPELPFRRVLEEIRAWA